MFLIPSFSTVLITFSLSISTLSNVLQTTFMKRSAKQKSLTYLALGDSYTIGEGVEITDAFPWQTVYLLKKEKWLAEDPVVIAKTGWTTGELQGAIREAQISREFDFVSLLIGVNNQYRDYPLTDFETEFSQLLNQAISFAGNLPDHVFVLSIPDWGKTPFAEGRDRKKISREIDAFNVASQKITTAAGAHYIDITADTRRVTEDPALVTGDRLHPSEKAYREWAQKLAAAVNEVFKQQ